MSGKYDSIIIDTCLLYKFLFPFSFAGSGKSHSMFGDILLNEKGIITTAVEYVIDKLPNITASFIEYYGEQWRDLGADSALFVNKITDNYKKTEITSAQDIGAFLQRMLPKRTTKSTNQNHSSSRSHALLIISSENGGQKMLFVNMAGNESLKGKENVRETCLINKSVAHLNTILSFKAKNQLAPYRDNDFTMFLKPYLTKNKVIIFYHFLIENLPKNLLVIEDCLKKTTKNEMKKIK